jgi:hypothetical protein
MVVFLFLPRILAISEPQPTLLGLATVLHNNVQQDIIFEWYRALENIGHYSEQRIYAGDSG